MNSIKLQPKLVVLSCFVFLLNLSLSDTMAQNSNYKIYSAVLSNQAYIAVGTKNPGTGLFVCEENGSNMEIVSMPNIRTFGIEIFPDFGDGLFYTANGNGVIVSRDGGKTWRVTTGWEITEILTIAALKSDPKTVYIGTAYGVWKSTEYGENWQRLTNRFVNSLMIDVEDDNRIYIGEEDGLIISKNNGKSFKATKAPKDGINALAQDSSNLKRLYLGSENNGIFISDNRGESWEQVKGSSSKATIYSVTIDPKDPQIVFATTFANGIFRSKDMGKTWNAITNGIDDTPVYSVAIHPDNSKIIYAGTVNRGLLKSTDGGDSWQQFALDGTHIWELEIK